MCISSVAINQSAVHHAKVISTSHQSEFSLTTSQLIVLHVKMLNPSVQSSSLARCPLLYFTAAGGGLLAENNIS